MNRPYKGFQRRRFDFHMRLACPADPQEISFLVHAVFFLHILLSILDQISERYRTVTAAALGYKCIGCLGEPCPC